ncbi:hypothetical protein QRD02_11650 [Aequorivita sp. SDUM287046]|uniref:Uncharacterized protein n=1 Tax=Aequorivita aurantiaca TaxID=3053356 RepID=A0ABT8DI06_9FLAO|nr:hypothetical protein [Aequorivita aurantiaca]MDN3725040.1 hypothetical protein [Aequorivita aurantiaca]
MKTKFSFRFLLMLFTIFMFIGCQDPSSHPPYEGPPKDHIISVAQAQEMYNAYSERRIPIIQEYEDSLLSDGSKFEPTRYAEYDLETIKQYIAFIEHEAKRANVSINTLRFYLSNYPNSTKFLNGDPVKYTRRNSIFVVPTTELGGENVGFSVEEINGNFSAVPINREISNPRENRGKTNANSTLQTNEAGFFMSNNAAAQGGGTTSLILNDGQLAPPPPTIDFGHNH